MLADGVERGSQKVKVAHAGYFDRILEGHEDAFLGPHFRCELQQVLALVTHFARSYVEAFTPGQHLGLCPVVEGDDPARLQQPAGLSHPATSGSLDRYSRADRDWEKAGDKLWRGGHRHQREAAP